MKTNLIKRVAFADFWQGFDPHDNLFQHLLHERFNIAVVNDMAQADFLIYSVFGNKHRNFPGPRLFYTAESVMPRWNECDGAITFLRDDAPLPGPHLRLPNWVVNYDIFHARTVERQSLQPDDILQRHTKFCNFIYSNPHAQERICFFKHLSRYKRIDSAGKVLNNTGTLIGNAFDFTKHYKFSIAFENVASRGYVTEKIMRAFSSGSLPIYWGDPDIALDINPRRFIHARDFGSPEELSDYIAEVDRDDRLYLSYFREPLFLPGQHDFDAYLNALETFIRQTLDQGIVRHQHPQHDNRQPSAHGYPAMPAFDDGKPWKRLPAEQKPHTPAHPEERLVDCIHPQWRDTLKILHGKAERLSPPHDTADVFDIKDDSFSLKWNRWGTERFVKSGTAYRLQPEQKQATPAHPKEPDNRIARINAPSRPPLIYLFGAPFHSNLGDQAQTECILRLLRDNLPAHGVILSTLRNSTPGLLAAIRANIRPEDLLLCHSGYHLTDLYKEQSIYLKLAELFPDHPLRILPQTIGYKSTRIADETAATLNNHPDCTLFCRDEHSFRTAQRLFHRCRLLLYPDLVTAMIGRTELPPHARKGVLFCMRNDKEARYPAERILSIRREIDRISTTSATDTTTKHSDSYTIAHRTELLHETINRFSHYQAIVTDRYHGIIFSLIANTPVIVLPSSDHKLTSGLQWFPDTFRQHIHLAETPDQIPALIRTLLRQDSLPPLPDYFASRYHDHFMEYLAPTAPNHIRKQPHIHENS